MKVFKIILGIIVTVVVLAVVYLTTLPASYQVERSVEINASSNMVMDHIANFKEWENWSPWKAKDPDAKYTYEGPEYGVGAKMSWITSLPPDNKNQIGEGGMTIVEVIGSETLKYELGFMKPWESSSQGGFDITSAENGSVTVRWYDSGELPFMMRPMGKMMDAMIGPDFENGLASLKAHIEEHTSMTKVDFAIEEVVIEPLSYLSITDSCVVAEIGAKSEEMFTKLGAYCGQNNISVSGSPFTFYHTWDGKSTVMESCFPTDETTEGSEEISAKTMMAGNALKLVYKGDYADSEQAHMAMGEFAETNGKEIIGSPWEVYLVGPMDTEDVNAFVTEIYYPIK